MAETDLQRELNCFLSFHQLLFIRIPPITCTVSPQDTVDTITHPYSHPFPYPTHHILNFPYYTMQFNTWLLFLTSFSVQANPLALSLSHIIDAQNTTRSLVPRWTGEEHLRCRRCWNAQLNGSKAGCEWLRSTLVLDNVSFPIQILSSRRMCLKSVTLP